jgi:hypothetical protein
MDQNCSLVLKCKRGVKSVLTGFRSALICRSNSKRAFEHGFLKIGEFIAQLNGYSPGDSVSLRCYARGRVFIFIVLKEGTASMLKG